MGRGTERSTGGTSGKSGNKCQRGCAANDSKLPRPRHLSPPATGATAATPSSESRLLSLGLYYDLSGAESACLCEKPELVCRPREWNASAAIRVIASQPEGMVLWLEAMGFRARKSLHPNTGGTT